jgi:hypothetical protein
MLWRHPDKFDLDKVKVVHYCAAVREFTVISKVLSTYRSIQIFSLMFIFVQTSRVQSHGGILEKKKTWIERTSRFW